MAKERLRCQSQCFIIFVRSGLNMMDASLKWSSFLFYGETEYKTWKSENKQDYFFSAITNIPWSLKLKEQSTMVNIDVLTFALGEGQLPSWNGGAKNMEKKTKKKLISQIILAKSSLCFYVLFFNVMFYQACADIHIAVEPLQLVHFPSFPPTSSQRLNTWCYNYNPS